VGGRVLVATGHYGRRINWLREAESGALAGQWRVSAGGKRVIIDAAAHKVMTLCRDGMLRVRSLAGDDAFSRQDDKAVAQGAEDDNTWPQKGTDRLMLLGRWTHGPPLLSIRIRMVRLIMSLSGV
jgi:hypothetical protein